MRLVIDLQGAQGSNRLRGIGRYSRELTLALAKESRDHEVVVVLNGTLGVGLDELIDTLRGVISDKALHLWHAVPGAPEVIGPHPLRRTASEILRAEMLRSLRPDVVLVTSLFGGADDDLVARWPSHLARPTTAAVCYDLIPLIHRAEYLDGPWRDTALLSWYFRCLHELSLADGLLAISEATRADVLAHLDTSQEYVANIMAGIDPSFQPVRLSPDERKALFARYGLRDEFVLFVGGGDPRKNEARLMQAYASLPEALLSRYQLVIVGQTDPAVSQQMARDANLPPGRLVLLRFVEEADLPALYSACSLFVMPSLYEGFGLPAAEAMACGAPAIGSTAASLPEVIGLSEALFNPTDTADIARVMERGLTDIDFRTRLTAHGLDRVRSFTWPMTASRAWDFLEARFAVPPSRQRTGRLPRLALTSPLPPEASGIADYTAELAPALARHYDVVLVSRTGRPDHDWLRSNFPVLTPEAAMQGADGFDRVLHQVGNSDFHAFQFDGLLDALPGTVTLHDSLLSGFALWRSASAGPDHFARVLHAEHGWPAVALLSSKGWREAALAFPCSGTTIGGALGVVQHSDHAGEILKHYGFHPGRERWRRIASLRRVPALPLRASARQRLAIGATSLVVASFGSVAKRKLPDRLVRAWRRLRQTHPDAVLALVGEPVKDHEIDELLAGELKPRQGEKLILTGRTTPETYCDWLAATDIAVQLRVGSRGETSRALADCLGAGLPTVVNRLGAGDEIPHDVVVAPTGGIDETALATTLADLVADPAYRRTAGERARKWVQSYLAPSNIAEQYRDAIETFYADAALRAAVGLSLLSARLPLGDSEDLRAVARTLAAAYPHCRPPHLFLDADGWNRSPEQAQTAKRLLLGHPPSIRVEAAVFDDARGWRSAPERAAQMLGIRSPTEPYPLMPARGDVLLFGSATDDLDRPSLAALEPLRRRGLRVIVPQKTLLKSDAASHVALFDGMAGCLAGDAEPPVGFRECALPDWLTSALKTW